MAFYRGPKIVTDGLVLYYDTDNTKSYVGEPTVNLLTSGNVLLTSYIDHGGTHVTDGNFKLFGNSALKNTSNPAQDWNGVYINGMSGLLTVGQTYTYSFYIYFDGTDTSISYFGYGAPGFTAVQGQWNRVSTTFVATSQDHIYVCLKYSLNQPVTTYYLANLQIELKSHPTQFINGSRSNTQGLLSLTTQKTTLDLTSMSYDSNAKLTFNGTSNDIRSLVSSSKTDVTLEGIVYVNLGTFGTYLSNGNDAGGYCIGIGANFNTADNQIVALFGAIRFIPTGVYYQYTGYHHIVMTLDGSSVPSIYINGVFIGTYPGTIPNNTSVGTGFCIGSQWGIRYSNMKCNIAKFYNKKLNATEVLQNYNAQKSRFGL